VTMNAHGASIEQRGARREAACLAGSLRLFGYRDFSLAWGEGRIRTPFLSSLVGVIGGKCGGSPYTLTDSLWCNG